MGQVAGRSGRINRNGTPGIFGMHSMREPFNRYAAATFTNRPRFRFCCHGRSTGINYLCDLD